MEGLGEMDPSVTQRLTLLVPYDIEAVHDRNQGTDRHDQPLVR